MKLNIQDSGAVAGRKQYVWLHFRVPLITPLVGLALRTALQTILQRFKDY